MPAPIQAAETGGILGCWSAPGTFAPRMQGEHPIEFMGDHYYRRKNI